MRHVYSDGELDEVDTPQYFPKILRKDFTIALNLQTSGPDPDPMLKIFYGCGASVNWDGYCNPEVDQLIEQQSREGNPERRKPILWEIERRLAADVARPILFYAAGANCQQPWVTTATSTAGVWRTSGSINKIGHVIARSEATKQSRPDESLPAGDCFDSLAMTFGF